jgi:hypothetical protein
MLLVLVGCALLAGGSWLRQARSATLVDAAPARWIAAWAALSGRADIIEMDLLVCP